MKYLLPVVIAASLAVGGCASKPAPKVSLDAPVAELAAQYTQAKKPELAGKRIVISSFGVEFQTKLKSSSTGGFGSTSSSSAILNLSGVTPETMQALADEAYAELVKDLAAAGYEVVDTATLQGNEDYQKLVKRALPSGSEITFQNHDEKSLTNKSLVFVPKGQIFYRPATDEAGQRMGLSTMGSSFKNMFSPNKNVEADLGKALKANVLKVYYVIGFGTVNTTTSGGYNGGATSHAQKAAAQLRIEGLGETRFAFRVPGKSLMSMGGNEQPGDGQAIVSISEHLIGDNTNILAGDVYNSTSTANRVGNAASVALGALSALGGGRASGTSNTQEFTAPADDALYRKAASKHLSLAEDLLLYRLQQGK